MKTITVPGKTTEIKVQMRKTPPEPVAEDSTAEIDCNTINASWTRTTGFADAYIEREQSENVAHLHIMTEKIGRGNIEISCGECTFIIVIESLGE